jgi:hypothetical protein
MAFPAFTSGSFLVRWVVALVLVLATYNPTGYSFFHWVAGMNGDSLPLKVLAGVVLAIVYVIYLRATFRSIGPIGMALAAALFGAILWVAIDFGILSLHDPSAFAWVVLVILATILAIGLSWSHVRRRVSGQADVDDVDE